MATCIIAKRQWDAKAAEGISWAQHRRSLESVLLEMYYKLLDHAKEPRQHHRQLFLDLWARDAVFPLFCDAPIFDELDQKKCDTGFFLETPDSYHPKLLGYSDYTLRLVGTVLPVKKVVSRFDWDFLLQSRVLHKGVSLKVKRYR